MTKKTILNILILLSLLQVSLIAKEKSLDKVSVQLKWFFQYQFAGIIMAKEKGFYENAGLDVNIKERDPKHNNILQVINGDSEYGLADSVILRYRAEGHPVKVLATIFQNNAMVLISKKSSGIVSPYEMRGKRIAYQEGLDDSMITSLLSYANIHNDDYIKRPMDFSHMDFVNGEVDISEAYISIEPYWMKEKYGIEVNVIDPKNYGINFYGDLIFTTQKEIDNHPKRVEAFKKATLQGWAYALQHKDETIKVILEKYNTRDLKYEQLLYEARVTENLIGTHYIALGDVRKERFSVLAGLYANRGIARSKLDKAVEDIIYDPNNGENNFTKYIYPIFFIGSILMLLVLLQFLYNRRLSYLVHERTRELEKSKLEAEHAAKSKATFLANMSHEIRTPMNAVLGFVEQLAKNEEDPSRIKMFKIIENSGNTLSTIINDILEISKIDSGKMEIYPHPCDTYSFFYDLKALFEYQCRSKHITYSVNVDDNVPKCVNIDETRLKQILTNIIGNAIKFTLNDGKISLTVSYDENTNIMSMSIIDNGIGISEENIDKIFHAFEQDDVSITRRFGGTGLGLAITQKLVSIMDGKISVESTLEQGSCFEIQMPILECSDELKVKEVDYTRTEIDGLEGKVLLVEDNATNQVLLGIILDELSLTYDIANNGKEATDMFKENAEDYNIILMDENMPIMNGMEAVKNIREIENINKLESIPIIAVTANALGGDKERFLEAGMNDYVSKPYTEKKIRDVLLKYMNK